VVHSSTPPNQALEPTGAAIAIEIGAPQAISMRVGALRPRGRHGARGSTFNRWASLIQAVNFAGSRSTIR
jgi:hypothetical protein